MEINHRGNPPLTHLRGEREGGEGGGRGRGEREHEHLSEPYPEHSVKTQSRLVLKCVCVSSQVALYLLKQTVE